jgi:GTPase SAR1 family protein
LAADTQPAKKSYFFDKGYKDLGNTIKGAWQRNFASIGEYRNNISLSKSVDDSKLYYFKLILNSVAIIGVLIVGSAITLVLSTIHIAILLVLMAIVYTGFTIVWTTDRAYLLRKKIFTACHECKEQSLIPIYICPNCKEKHTNLTPGVYGILKRTCNCGKILGSTFFNGRRELESICQNCWHEGKITYLNNKETVPICIPVVGGRSVGKTAFINAFSKDFIEKVAPAKSWEIEHYSEAKSDIYKQITQDYKTGSTRITARPQDVNKASSVSFSFFVKGDEFKPERLIHVYDIAGEVFTDNSENEVQKQYEYCQGIVLIIDPFSIPSVRYKRERYLMPEDIAGIGKADINGIVNSFLNKLKEVTGLNDSKMLSVPLAVVISKADSAGIFNELGESSVKDLMKTDPKFNNAMDVQDYLCRKFLKDNGMESFLNIINIRFKNNRFFVCSAIGHTRDKGIYKPKGVMEPMEWLFRQADSKMDSSWHDTDFTKHPFALKAI